MKVFTPFIKKNKDYLPILSPNFGTKIVGRMFLRKAVEQLTSPIFDIVPKIEEALFILIPYDFFNIEENKEYLRKVQELSKKYKKKILIFDYSDFDKDINVKNCLIFRTSQYKYKQKENEFIIPPLVEDLGMVTSVLPRKKSKKPVVGFVGWADFLNLKQKIKYQIRIFLVDIQSLWNLNAKVHKQGIYFRRKVIILLERSSLIKTNFILRKSFSAHALTIELETDRARREYIQNIINSDFVLCAKGDGNYSNRFYEVLSLGRIPIMIDTEQILPLEEIIDYDKFVLRIGYKDIKNIENIITNFYKNLSDREFVYMQKKAVEVFKEYLKPSVFYDKLFMLALN